MFKLPIFLVTLSLLQLSICSPVEDFQSENLKSSRAQILAELSVKVLELQLNISSTALNVGTSISDCIRAENIDVDAASNGVNDNLKNLDETVTNATEAAKKAKKSIDACVKAVKTDEKKVDLSKISKCASPKSLTLLKLKLSKFSTLAMEAYTIVPKCSVLHPVDNDKLEECAMSSIDGYRNSMNDIKNKIQSDAQVIVRNDDTCIQENAGELNATIKEISNTFTICVMSA